MLLSLPSGCFVGKLKVFEPLMLSIFATPISTLEIKILTKQFSCIKKQERYECGRTQTKSNESTGIVIPKRGDDGGKRKLNKTIKLLLDCDALNLIRLIKNNKVTGNGGKKLVKFSRK